MNKPTSGNLSVYVYGGWIALLSVLYFFLIHSNQTRLLPFAWGAIGISGIVAIISGLIKHKPAVRSGWLLLAAANLFFIAGDTYYKVLHYILNKENPFPSFSDVLYLTTYPLFALGTYIFIRRRSFEKTDRGAILDAATFTVGLALLVWIYLVIPNAAAGDTPFLAKMTSIAYPLGDVLVWAMLVRLLIIDARTRSIQLLAIGALGLVVADIIYGLGQFYGFWHEGSPVDLGWILFYGAWGAAALHPSMKSLDNKVAKLSTIHIRRLILLAATALIAPLVLLIETLRGHAGQVSSAVAVFAAILFILVVTRMFTLLREITRRDAEISLEKQKREVIALVSHQLRTPLTIIQLYTQQIQQNMNMEQGLLRKAVGAIDAAGQRLSKLIKTLLYSVTVGLGELEFTIAPQDIKALVEAAMEENRDLLTEKQINYHVETDPDLPAVPTDTQATVSALSFVINNAIRYSKNHDAQLTIRLRSDTDNAYIVIQDNGVGIPEEDQPKIFTRLFRASNAITSYPEGVGLGLYLAKNVINRLGGDIRFSSKPDAGSTFTITLPLQNSLHA